MCLIRLRPDREEEVKVPNRPIRADVPSSRQGRGSYPVITTATAAAAAANEYGQSTRELEARSRESIALPEHAVVIQQHSPRSSKLQIRHGSAYSYGDGPTPVEPQAKPPQERHGSQRSEHAAQVRQRPGSLAFAKSPRQSSASYRSTRERIVVIDDSGRRREYYKRDDSGR